MDKKKIKSYFGLILAIGSVIAYREIPPYWFLFMWIPITIGYELYFHTD